MVAQCDEIHSLRSQLCLSTYHMQNFVKHFLCNREKDEDDSCPGEIYIPNSHKL